MKDEESQSSSITTVKRQPSSSEFPITNSNSSAGAGGVLFGRGRYKFWALAAILLLAFWSMFTGSVTLKWSSVNNLNPNYNPLSDSPLHDDLDILEVEEREKLVRRLWDVYTHSSTTIRLPRFWLEAFEAAYEHLTSEDVGVKNAAFSEIAKMSLLSLNVDPPPAHSSERFGMRFTPIGDLPTIEIGRLSLFFPQLKIYLLPAVTLIEYEDIYSLLSATEEDLKILVFQNTRSGSKTKRKIANDEKAMGNAARTRRL